MFATCYDRFAYTLVNAIALAAYAAVRALTTRDFSPSVTASAAHASLIGEEVDAVNAPVLN